MLEQKIIDEALKIKGEVRGTTFITDAKYLEDKFGPEGLKKIQQEMEKIGQSVYAKKIQATSWYPLSQRVLLFLIIKDVFKLKDEDFFAMGLSGPKYSFIVKTLLKYFISVEKTFAETAKYWSEHWTVGNLSTPVVDIKHKHIVVQLNDFKVHPLFCNYLKGYFKTIAKLILNSKIIKIEEAKCVFKGDLCHQYIIDWD